MLNSQTEKSAKVWTGNVPLSCANREIGALKKVGCELRSALKLEQARDRDGKLTKWETRRRLVFIASPSTPPAPTLKVSIFTAEIYHKEQKNPVKTCQKCLRDGHIAANCQNEIVCSAEPQGTEQASVRCQMPLSPHPPSSPPSIPPPPISPYLPLAMESRATESNKTGASLKHTVLQSPGSHMQLQATVQQITQSSR